MGECYPPPLNETLIEHTIPTVSVKPLFTGLSCSIRPPINKTAIRHLQDVSAHIRFVSAEPLLGALGALNLAGVDWLIAGGESGVGCRSMDVEWVTDLRDRCVQAGVPFFFKQWGGRSPKAGGRELDGRTWDEYPDTQVTMKNNAT